MKKSPNNLPVVNKHSQEMISSTVEFGKNLTPLVFPIEHLELIWITCNLNPNFLPWMAC